MMLHHWLDHLRSLHSQVDRHRHSVRRNPRQRRSHLAENLYEEPDLYRHPNAKEVTEYLLVADNVLVEDTMPDHVQLQVPAWDDCR